jgi:DNA-directed RNA polymerase specialized sigma24 family protein
VEKLPDRAREIVKLRYGTAMACKEVSKEIGIPTNAVKMALVRVRSLLRGCIKSSLSEA